MRIFIGIKGWWQRISYLGVTDKISPTEQVGVVLLNRTVVVGITVVCLLYFKQLIVNGAIINPPVFIFLPLIISVLYLHYRQCFRFARLFVNLIFPPIIALIIAYYGATLHAEYTFFIFITTAVFFFRANWQRFLLIVYNISLFLVSYFYALAHPSPWEPAITTTEPVTLFILTAICVVMIIAAYIQEIRQKDAEIVRVLADLKQKNSNLLSAYQEIERFAYITSHDLKTPLRNISSFTGLLELKLKAGQYEEVDECLQFIKEGSRRMHQLIEDSLEYARVERLDNEPYQAIELEELVRSIEQDLSPLASNPIKIVTTDLPNVYGRRLYLHMLLQNLIENGVKYNDKSLVEIEVAYRPDSAGIILDIRDNGIGIAPDFQEQVFEMFKRLHTEKEYPGTGIGLSICKKIVEKMNGTITLTSTPGVGSTFSVCLPLKLIETAVAKGELAAVREA